MVVQVVSVRFLRFEEALQGIEIRKSLIWLQNYSLIKRDIDRISIK